MSKFLIPAIVALVIGAAPAFAATTASPAPAKSAAPATAAAPADKKADCTKQWAAQKKHTKTMKAFMAACTK